MKLAEILSKPIIENAVASYDDLYDSPDVTIVNKEVLDKFARVGTIEVTGYSFTVFRNTTTDEFALACLDNHDSTKYHIVSEFEILHHSDILGLKNLYVMKEIVVALQFQRKGIATKIYRFLIENLGYTIIGDSFQYFGDRKTWVKLSYTNDVRVDIIDIVAKNI